jgi:Na+/H+ antiporter NhaD/arsenite permease-like protein
MKARTVPTRARRVAPWSLVGGAGLCLLAQPAHAAGLDGRLPVVLALPFAGMLLSIALGPLLFAHVWHAHYGKIAALWAALAVLGLAMVSGAGPTAAAAWHTLALEYVPFLIMLFALFTIAGGFVVEGNLHGSPAVNTTFLGIGALSASLVGTTGASMILIRPLLRANDDRLHNAHTIVFFIFLVSNIGGALTPLGDPPLFLGFLRGVDFFWTLKHLWPESLFAVATLLIVFFALDSRLYRKEGHLPRDPTPDSPLVFRGRVNLLLLGAVIAAIILSGVWKPGVEWTLFGVRVELQNVVRDIVMIAAALASLALTPKDLRERNGFSWDPIIEVAKLFAGIFLAIIPVMAMLQAGRQGPFAGLLDALSTADGRPHDGAYFWATGALSSFLDNAPTYLVFFELAGGDPARLMGPMASTLAAISLGAVFMGAVTYVGNAPNFMVYAIARQAGVTMPGFFGYMLWSIGILAPLFIAVHLIFLR